MCARLSLVQGRRPRKAEETEAFGVEPQDGRVYPAVDGNVGRPGAGEITGGRRSRIGRRCLGIRCRCGVGILRSHFGDCGSRNGGKIVEPESRSGDGRNLLGPGAGGYKYT